ncbi:STAS domain-containing protein [Marinobacter salinisoli]|uniref:STAS domain-containing protein n=1 Tax=Marinobacter salinisoli TaxID=2769486 RepID=A0ABX7MQ20_9GAMM|nr:STAS domain-containing protein [Marinobacter salinisoli]QSP94405.1 STAS domain-containing protein [Marinobacter salinisoli]
MPIETRHLEDSQTLVISIDGRFDFSTHQAFRDAYEHCDNLVDHYVVDLSETTYLDSSALGMLLLLRDYAGGDSAKISIENCNSDVRRILSISNFEQLFAIR